MLNSLRRLDLPHRNAIFHKINTLYHTRINTRDYNTEGIDIVSEDWDNLLILDGCRYDLFESQHSLPGTLESRESRGTSTKEFLEANFDGQELHDIVYITANPVLYRHRDEIDVKFHSVVNIWNSEGWDEHYKTVLPETTTAYAQEAAENYPDKRLIIHYIQPHYPFITEDTSFDKTHLHKAENDEVDFWKQIKFGRLDMSSNRLWDLYAQNLDRALPHVEELLTDLTGKTVVTADHGNMIGEQAFPVPIREWGHPARVYTEELVKVPWFIFESKTRKSVSAEEPESEANQVNNEVVESRLRSLGYRE